LRLGGDETIMQGGANHVLGTHFNSFKMLNMQIAGFTDQW